MNWLEQWRALAARIDGLVRAGEFLVSAFGLHNRDELTAFRTSLSPEFKAITEAIEALGQDHANEIPTMAEDAIRRYVSQNWHGRVAQASNSGATIAVQTLAPLIAFRSEFEYLIRDSEIEGRSLTELAFEHLRRQIVVDEDIRKKWQAAFDKHETACEALGAVHLLSHGIWAFKINARGGATDLVYGDSILDRAPIVRKTARALVLTEWKRVRDNDDIYTSAAQGRSQAAIYAGGVLGDLELKRTRYIVLVSNTELNAPDDYADEGVTYRHLVIPTKPVSPSQQARSLAANPRT